MRRKLNALFVKELAMVFNDRRRTPGGCTEDISQFSRTPGGCVVIPSPTSAVYSFDGKPK